MPNRKIYDDVCIEIGYKPEQLELEGVLGESTPTFESRIHPLEKFEKFIGDFEKNNFEDSEKDYQEFITRGKVALAIFAKINNCLAKKESDEKTFLTQQKLRSQGALEGVKILEISGEKETMEEFKKFGADVTLISPYGKAKSRAKQRKNNDARRKKIAESMAASIEDRTSSDSFDLINVDRNNLYYALATNDEFEEEKASAGLEKIMKSINNKIYKRVAQFGKLENVEPKIAVVAYTRNLSK